MKLLITSFMLLYWKQLCITLKANLLRMTWVKNDSLMMHHLTYNRTPLSFKLLTTNM